jgi:hypothetical protein
LFEQMFDLRVRAGLASGTEADRGRSGERA